MTQAFSIVRDISRSVVRNVPVSLGNAPAWSPGDLGAALLTWLEADPEYLFQGTIANAAQTDTAPVGFVGDKKGPLGAELVTNGTFDTDTAWTKGNGWAIAGGVATANTTLASERLSQPITLSNDKSYLVTCTFTMLATPVAGAAVTVLTEGPGQNVFTSSQANLQAGQTYTIRSVHTPTSVVGGFSVGVRSNFNYVMNYTVDNVSVREITGIHATQATSSARPLYRTGAGLPYLQHDGADDGVGAVLTPSNANVYLLMRTSDTRGALISARSVSNYAGYFIDTEATPIGQAGVGSPTYVVDGAAVTLRNQMSAAIATGSFLVAEVRGADLSAWSQVSPFTLASAADFIAGDLAAVIITDASTETTQDRNNIRSYLQGLIP